MVATVASSARLTTAPRAGLAFRAPAPAPGSALSARLPRASAAFSQSPASLRGSPGAAGVLGAATLGAAPRGAAPRGSRASPARAFHLRLVSTGAGTSGHLKGEAGTHPPPPPPPEFPLSDGEEVVVGRADDADLKLPYPTVSAHHARLRIKGLEVEVTDLGSTNGTFLNGRAVPKGTPRILLPGNEVVFGDGYLARFLLGISGEPDDANN